MQGLKENTLSVTKEFVIQLKGSDVYKVFIQNGNLSILVTNLGCSIISIEAPDKSGVKKNVVAGFTNIEDYLVNRDYLGCVVGRYANRIAEGKFALDGKQFQLPINNDGNHLHGGIEGFHKKIWDIIDLSESKDSVAVTFTYLSEDGEEGYPGNLQVTVRYSLNKQNQLRIEYAAQTDKATPINLTNHSYFNLTGFDAPVINDHLLEVNASYYTEKNERNVPTGTILKVADTALDFRNLKKIGADIAKFPGDFGFDHNFVLEKHAQGETVFAAKLYEPSSGRVLKVYTSQPGIQVYTANYWDGTIKGVQGKPYQKHGAVALETQAFPDSPNYPSFPDTILYPGQRYVSKTIYEFGIE
jgi:aldose 1-epimerase